MLSACFAAINTRNANISKLSPWLHMDSLLTANTMPFPRKVLTVAILQAVRRSQNINNYQRTRSACLQLSWLALTMCRLSLQSMVYISKNQRSMTLLMGHGLIVLAHRIRETLEVWMAVRSLRIHLRRLTHPWVIHRSRPTSVRHIFPGRVAWHRR